MMQSEAEDPCLQKGYTLAPGAGGRDVYKGRSQGGVRGTGDYHACRRLVKKMVLGDEKKKSCKKEPCAIRGVHQPRFWEQGGKMVLFEHFRCGSGCVCLEG